MDADLTTALNNLLQLLAAGAITWLTTSVANWLKQLRDDKRRAFVIPMFTTAINYAIKDISAGVAPTKEQVLERASNYMFEHAADALKALGLDYTGVESALEARLPSSVK